MVEMHESYPFYIYYFGERELIRFVGLKNDFYLQM